MLGALIGFQRQIAGKLAGLRTHFLVCAGTGSGMSGEAISRVIQGIATGIGFIGTGTILKLQRDREIHGLTAGIGVAVGVGSLGLAALIAAGLTWAILQLFGRPEDSMEKRIG